ncbi:uncharacterized protein LOC115114322 isoform X2 [Oncorhynchus nerka]|uniref:uncharacterized protein LOC115114322 isoform X2 n=1 Tax=Oncorhynchus nerka TaxID=8023 RepID=UPI0011307BBA|nr:uncharacterized protein LOC115114322 isoform X2 [Oncorhynchus nerka]
MLLPLTFILFFNLSWGLPIDTVILFQRSGVVGEMETVEQVLVNGAPPSSSGKNVSGILRAVLMGNYESFHQAFEIEENVTNTMTNTWTAEVPQALSLKQLWDWDTEFTRREKMQLHEICTELMKELRQSEPTTNRGTSLLTVLAPLFACLTFVVMVIASFLISKQQDPRVSRHPGGVLGSIVHYYQNVTETQSGKDYQGPLKLNPPPLIHL